MLWSIPPEAIIPDALSQPSLAIDAYIEGELRSETRHEYLAGAIHAMVGASDAHNIIAGNLFPALHIHLRGGPSRV